MLARLLKQIFRRDQPSASPVQNGEQAVAVPEPAQDSKTPLHARPEINQLLATAGTLQDQGKAAESEPLCRQALGQDPGFAYAHLLLAIALAEQGKANEALNHALYAQHWMPNHAASANQAGIVHMALGNYSQAILCLQRAVQLNPASPSILCNLGILNLHIGEAVAARQCLEQALCLNPELEPARMNLALICLDLGDLSGALDHACKLACHADQHISYQQNLEQILLAGWHLPEAARLEQALFDACQQPANHCRLEALSCLQAGRHQEAAEKMQTACAISGRPEDAWLLGQIELGLQRWGTAWTHYEQRLQTANFPRQQTGLPCWSGESLHGKSMYVQSEQGLGEQILFAGCLPDLLASGCQITLECHPKLLALFCQSFPQITLRPQESMGQLNVEETRYDYVSSLGSLPRWLRQDEKDFAAPAAYLKTTALQAQSGKNSPPVVGICWRGGLPQTGRYRRSLSLEMLAPLLRCQNVRFCSLQQDESPAETGYLNQAGIQAFSPDGYSLENLAAMIATCDQVITVCSTVAHLAGALGTKTCVLTPLTPPWAYGYAEEIMPWYPDVHLLRQTRADDWSEPLDRALQTLRELA